MKRLVLVLAAALAILLVVYAVVGTVVVPWVAKDQVVSLLADRLGIEAEIESVSFDPFGFALSAHGFQMGEAGFRELHVDLDVRPLLDRAVVVDQVRLVGAVVELRIDESGALRIAGIGLGGDVPEEPEPVPEPDAGAAESPVSALEIRSLAIENGRFRFVDASRTPAVDLEVGPIDLRVAGLGLTRLLDPAAPGDGAPAQVDLSLALDEATLSVQGSVDPEPLRLDLELALEELPLAVLQPFVAPIVRVELRDGLASAEGRLRYDDEVAYSGSFEARRLDVGEPGVEPPMLAWRSLEVTGIDVAGPPWRVALGGVDLAEPRARLVQTAKGSNVASAFARDDPEPLARDDGEPPAGDGESVQIEVGPVALRDGTVAFEDRTVAPVYRVKIQQLQVKVDGVASRRRSQLDLSGQADGYAPVEIHGTLEPFAFTEFTDVTASAKDLELSSFSPYSGRYVGKAIEGGRGSVDLHVKIDGHVVDSQNVLVLDDLDFGAAVDSPDATSLPVPAAAVLLANADGEIRVELPVRGNLDDPDFSYTGTLLNTVRRLITRVVQSPFEIVGGMVSIGGMLFPPEELGAVDFGPGAVDLSERESLKLSAIGTAMLEDPKLEVEVSGGADPALDGDGDLRVLARQRAAAVRGKLEAAGVDVERIQTGDVEVGEGLSRVRLQVR